MKKSLLALAIAQMMTMPSGIRARTRDVSFGYRMGTGFPGDVNRTHPFSAVPGLMDTTNPVRLYGDPVLINTAANSYRGLLTSDTAVTKIDGVLVRPYPISQTTGGMTASFGAAVPPVGPSVCDVLNEGFILARCNNFAAQQPTKGGAVFIWVAASTGAHVLGGFESVTNASAIAITNAKWAGPVDPVTGVGEIQVMAPGA